MPKKKSRAWRNREHPYPAVRRSAPLSAFLAKLEKTKGELSKSDRLTIVDQALVLLEMNYVHLPLKRAIHAVDPIQRLRLLKSRLEEVSEDELPGEMNFHQEMQRVFISTRDLHTSYFLPTPFTRKTAYLPFLIEEFFETDNEAEPKFLVSKLAKGFHHPTFKPGVEILYWNGAPMKRAIEMNGENQAGSNLAARFANGLFSLTIRPLYSSLPPDEEWVVLTYRALDGEVLELKQKWWVFSERRGEGIELQFIGGRDTNIGVDMKKAAVSRGRLVLFAPEVAVKKTAVAKSRRTRFESLGNGLETKPIKTRLGEFFRAFVIRTRRGKEIAYIRIFSFYLLHTNKFVREFVRLVTALPPDGLIIDVRNNSGGNINAAEQLLQLFTPHRVKPELFELINTPLNLEICRAVRGLSSWTQSLEEAVETGALYSLGFPLTSEESCNSIGQIYFGPVVLINDPLCYSATDMFTAGFADHKIGTVLGVGGNTGAGGANVVEHEYFRRTMRNKANSPYRPLPNGVGMGVAFRRSIRVGDCAAGRPLEDLGVIPDERHFITKDDLLKRNGDLIKHAVRILASKRAHKLSINIHQKSDGTLTIAAATKNISRLDLYIDDRPQRTRDVVNGRTEFNVKLPSRRYESRPARIIMLRGFDGKKLVATLRRKLE